MRILLFNMDNQTYLTAYNQYKIEWLNREISALDDAIDSLWIIFCLCPYPDFKQSLEAYQGQRNQKMEELKLAMKAIKILKRKWLISHRTNISK